MVFPAIPASGRQMLYLFVFVKKLIRPVVETCHGTSGQRKFNGRLFLQKQKGCRRFRQ
jgi:hypothetical protein